MKPAISVKGYGIHSDEPFPPELAKKYASNQRRKRRLVWTKSKPNQTLDADGWIKPCARNAFHGVAGEFVALVEPHSEADRAGLLIQFLVAFGNVIGRTAYRTAGGARHYLNLFAALVGKSAKSRKGSSWAEVKRLFEFVDPEWCERSVLDGLSTGEGLIHAVRDGRGDDAGVDDKRVLVIEAEFARVLKMTERKENTLSPVIRAAWDSGELNVLTKTTPAEARGAHISIIGHITREELTRNLNSTEVANGFANRFLWVAVHRSKELPFGGNVPEEQLQALAEKVRTAVKFAKELTAEIEFSEEAREIWNAVYGPLSGDRDGLVGAIVSRAEAQTLRLACLYAVLDGSNTIQPVHLDAALALWDYCERSAVLIFGSSTGDQIVDAILEALRANRRFGLTRTEISKLFSRNMDGDRLAIALATLIKKGLAKCVTENLGNGRPTERWRAIGD